MKICSFRGFDETKSIFFIKRKYENLSLQNENKLFFIRRKYENLSLQNKNKFFFIRRKYEIYFTIMIIKFIQDMYNTTVH